MVCPFCGQNECVRLHRRGFLDQAMRLAALKPWRCMRCRQRFYARKVARELMRYAHCPQCGNFELQHVESSEVRPRLATAILRKLHAAAYRCEVCELNFHSLGAVYDATAGNLARQ